MENGNPEALYRQGLVSSKINSNDTFIVEAHESMSAIGLCIIVEKGRCTKKPYKKIRKLLAPKSNYMSHAPFKLIIFASIFSLCMRSNTLVKYLERAPSSSYADCSNAQ